MSNHNVNATAPKPERSNLEGLRTERVNLKRRIRNLNALIMRTTIALSDVWWILQAATDLADFNRAYEERRSLQAAKRQAETDLAILYEQLRFLDAVIGDHR